MEAGIIWQIPLFLRHPVYPRLGMLEVSPTIGGTEPPNPQDEKLQESVVRFKAPDNCGLSFNSNVHQASR